MRKETRLRNLVAYSNYDLGAGRQAPAAMVGDDASADKPLTRLTFLLNFFDELGRRAPASK